MVGGDIGVGANWSPSPLGGFGIESSGIHRGSLQVHIAKSQQVQNFLKPPHQNPN